MELLAFWFGFSLVVAVAANTRGRNAIGWFLLALAISPVFGGLLLLALPGVIRPDRPIGITTDENL